MHKERNQLFDRHYRDNFKTLVRQAMRYVGTKSNAEDVVQDAYMKALQYWKPGIENIDGWFYQLFRNCIKNFQHDQRMQGMTDELQEIPVPPAALPAHLLGRLDHAINTMNDQVTARALRMYFFEQQPSAEIADQLPMSHGAIRVAIHRFRKDFKNLLGNDAEEAMA